jgi:hypothetical protein
MLYKLGRNTILNMFALNTNINNPPRLMDHFYYRDEPNNCALTAYGVVSNLNRRKFKNRRILDRHWYISLSCFYHEISEYSRPGDVYMVVWITSIANDTLTANKSHTVVLEKRKQPNQWRFYESHGDTWRDGGIGMTSRIIFDIDIVRSIGFQHPDRWIRWKKLRTSLDARLSTSGPTRPTIEHLLSASNVPFYVHSILYLAWQTTFLYFLYDLFFFRKH